MYEWGDESANVKFQTLLTCPIISFGRICYNELHFFESKASFHPADSIRFNIS